MHPTDLIRLNIELEYEVVSDSLLAPRPGADPAEVPRFSVIRHDGGYVTYSRHDLHRGIRDRLAEIGLERAFSDHKAVKRVLADDMPCKEMWIWKGCYFTRIPLLNEFPNVVWHDQCYIVKVAGEPVAWAWTVCGNERAAEVAVETLPAFRRCGYGRQVTAAWAHDVMRAGKIAFYSHASDNLASQALAQSLDAIQYAVFVEYG